MKTSESQATFHSDNSLIQAVHDTYSAVARSGADPTYSNKVAQAFGYTIEQLQSIPAESHMGLSCGNPVSAATIKEGENVLDLGSGGGVDILLAAAKAGPLGHVVGLDISSDMLSLARRNALKKGLKPPQVSFVQASLTESLPIRSGTIDCILSNCVINLLPLSGKVSLFKEICRILKPGGRVVLDDIVTKKPLSEKIRNDMAAYVSCISGAIDIELYKKLLGDAGLHDAVFIDTRGDINIYFKESPTSACCAPSVGQECCAGTSGPASASRLHRDFDANAWVASYQIYAIKPHEAGQMDGSNPLLHWWDAYPKPKFRPPIITCEDLASLLRDSSHQDEYAIIDVDGSDRPDSHAFRSTRYPAQQFYNGLSEFTEKFKAIKQVIFCGGDSNEDVAVCAGWYQDHLDESSISISKAYILGGISERPAKFEVTS